MSTGKWKKRRLTERSFRGRFCADVGGRLPPFARKIVREL